MAHTVTTKYNPATGKITAKCWRKTVRIEGYTTKAVSGAEEAHREALAKLLAFLNVDRDGVEWFEIACAEGIDANTYTFIIDTRSTEIGRGHEYRITWEIDTVAASHADAARWVADTYFAQSHNPYFEVKCRTAGWKDKHPVIVDLAK